MNLKLKRIDFHRRGNCWTWREIHCSEYYSGKQVQITWWRFSLVFEEAK